MTESIILGTTSYNNYALFAIIKMWLFTWTVREILGDESLTMENAVELSAGKRYFEVLSISTTLYAIL